MELANKPPLESGSPGPTVIRVEDLLIAAWRLKIWIAFFSLLCASAAYVAAKSLPKQYESTIVLSPNSEDGGSTGKLGALSSMFSDMGGLASLAGLGAPAGGQRAEAVAMLQSESVTEQYIESEHLLPILYADKWNDASHQWVKMPSAKVPTLWKANQLFKKRIRTVITDNKTGLITLTIRWTDPLQAAKWANGIVALTNDVLRNKAILQAEKNISYLNEQAGKYDVLSIKQGIYTLLQAEVNKVMLAKGRSDYALKVLDPAFPSERAVSPVALLWATVGGLFGLMVSGLAIYIRKLRSYGAWAG